MDYQTIKALITAQFTQGEVHVGGDGYHVDVVVVSDTFAGKRAVQRQQMVYAALNDAITSGALHAVNMKTYTPEEWQAAQ